MTIGKVVDGSPLRKHNMLAYALLTMAITLTSCAETFLWNYHKSNSGWRDYGTPSNWRVGTSDSSPVSTTLVPGANDYICLHEDENAWSTYRYMDLGGVDRTILGLTRGDTTYGDALFSIKNGSLTVTENFTNIQANVYIEDTGSMTLAATSSSRFGLQGMPEQWHVKSGGRLSMLGSISVAACRITNYDGGIFTFDPASLTVMSTFSESNGHGASIANSGTLNLPNGIDVRGTANSANTGYFRLFQLGGTLNLGGSLVSAATYARFAFILSGGTVNVTNDATFTKLNANPFEASMTNGASATVCVTGGKTFDASIMVFEENTVLQKTGDGTLKLSAVPSSLSVAAGTVSFLGGSSLGSSLTLSPGATMHIAGPEVSAHAIAGISNANVTVDSSLTSGGTCLIFVSDDPQLVQAVADRLTASGATGLTVTDSGISHEVSHQSTIFAWANEGSVDYSNFTGGTYAWYSFFNPASWKIGVAKETNAEGLIPGENDDFFISDNYQPLFAIDMCGQHRKLRHLHRNFTTGTTYSNQAGFRQFNIRNGTLEFTGSFTNVRASVDAKADGRFILSSTSSARLGHDFAEDDFFAEDGGEIDIYGAIKIHRLNMTVHAGGKVVFDPVSLEYDTTDSKNGVTDSFVNGGILELPSGLALNSRGDKSHANSWFAIRQNAGTLKLGGSIARGSAYYTRSIFQLNGGTIEATANAAISGFDTCEMTSNSVATVNVSSGMTLDLSEMVFGEGTSLTKTGAGTVVLGASVPEAMSVLGGSVKYLRTVNLGSSLSLSPGTKIIIGANGICADGIAGIADASVELDSSLGDSSRLVFASDSPSLLATVLSKLRDSIQSPGSLAISGNALVYEKAHEPTVFSWKTEGTGSSAAGNYLTETNANGSLRYTWKYFCDADSWAVGLDKNGSNPDGLIPGENDDMYVSASYYPIFGMDMGGSTRKLRNLELNLVNGSYPNQAGFRGFYLRNGTLEFTGCFTNVRIVVKAKTGSRFVLGETSYGRYGYNGAGDIFYADDGGEIDLLGTMDIHYIQFTIAEGGKAVIAPKKFTALPTGNQGSSFIRNSGTLSFPDGITFEKGGYNNNCSIDITNYDTGTLELGGPFVREDDFKMLVNLVINGGTLNVTNKVSFSGFNSLTMADDATVDIYIPKRSRLDLRPMVFGSNTTVNKHGEGLLLFGASLPTVYTRDDTPPGLAISFK